MKVEINTKEKSVYVIANDVAKSSDVVDERLKAIKVARDWLKKELNEK